MTTFSTDLLVWMSKDAQSTKGTFIRWWNHHYPHHVNALRPWKPFETFNEIFISISQSDNLFSSNPFFYCWEFRFKYFFNWPWFNFVCLSGSVQAIFQEFKLASGLPVVCIGFELTFSALDKDWVNMVCSGLEPGAAGWKTQTNPLSYGGTLC